MITKGGGYPSPLNYHSFPKSVCTSVNEVICHGIPDARELVEGDIVNVDVTAFLNGFHGDLNETFLVGECDEESKKLVRVAYECLHKAIELVKPGTRYRDIGEAISRHASMNNLSVVRVFDIVFYGFVFSPNEQRSRHQYYAGKSTDDAY